MTRLFFLSFLCFLTGAISAARAGELPKPNHAQVKLYSTVSTIAPGEPFSVIIEQLIEPDWHTYWENPGDSGTSINVKWSLPDGSQANALEYPIPSRIAYGPLVNFGYSNRALFAATLTPPDQITGGSYTLKADIDWLVCKDICLPEGDTYTLTLPVSAGGPIVNTDMTDILHDLTASHPVKTDWNARYHDDGGQVVLTFTPSRQTAALLNEGGKIAFFPKEWGLIQNAGEQILVLTDGDQAMLSIPAGDRARSEISTFESVFVIEDHAGKKLGYSTPVAPLAPAQAPADTKPAFQERTGFVAALFFALLGGVILNLMPCVFPVLSLKVLSLARATESEIAHMRPHGLAYGAGVIVTFLIIAALLMTLQQAGSSVGWGFQLQQPLVVILLAYLFTLIGFNLMGWFEIDIARYIPSQFHSQREGWIGSFATGILATLVATPCTAPFMGAALGYALTHHPAAGLLVFTMLGVGLALPFVVLTFVPQLHRYLPKPGAWMLTLRQFLAFPMFLTAAWLAWVLGHQTGIDGVGFLLLGLILIGFMLWLTTTRAGGKTTRTLRFLATGIGVLLLVFVTFMPHKWDAPTKAGVDTELAFTPAALDMALASGKPVFVNMTAAWCITCKVNERVAIHTEGTARLLAQTGTLYLKGDWTNYNADITAYLAEYGREGVPLYVYYGPPDQTGARPAPTVLPQILTPSILKETFTSRK